jgi:ribosomal protein S18 acetylase RimI-like enzyme
MVYTPHGSSTITVRDFAPPDLAKLAELFNDFRIFYERDSNLEAAKTFVAQLLHDGLTRFFIAWSDGEMAGFVHLVPYLDTLAMTKAWILEDLFVTPGIRQNGIGGRLLQKAEQFARNDGASRLSLTTAHTNRTAQRLYEACDYKVDTIFRTYHLDLV